MSANIRLELEMVGSATLHPSLLKEDGGAEFVEAGADVAVVAVEQAGVGEGLHVGVNPLVVSAQLPREDGDGSGRAGVQAAEDFKTLRSHDPREGGPGFEGNVGLGFERARFGGGHGIEDAAFGIRKCAADVNFSFAHIRSPRIATTSASKSSNSFASVVKW